MNPGDKVVITKNWQPDTRTGTLPKGTRGEVAFYIEPGWLVDFNNRNDFASVIVTDSDPVEVVKR